jgi:hypothetical protein
MPLRLARITAVPRCDAAVSSTKSSKRFQISVAIHSAAQIVLVMVRPIVNDT